MFFYRFFTIIGILGVFFTPLFSNQWCEYHFGNMEKAYNIPSRTLHAISLTESGKHIPKKGMVAWPWSININGKGYLFPTKQKAILAAKFLKQSGFSSFDVGCMQINMMHHEDAFDSLEDAFDPEKNVAYAAYFLSSLKTQLGNWQKAVGYYHNANPSFHIPYQKKVYSFLNRLSEGKIMSYLPEAQDGNLLHIHMNERFQDAEMIYSTSFKDMKKPTVNPKVKILPVITAAPLNYKKNHEFQKLNSLYTGKKGGVAVSSRIQQSKNQGKFAHLNTMTVNHFLYRPK